MHIDKVTTPNEEYGALNDILEVKNIILKREDKHIYGSHKGRSIPKMIDIYMEQGIKEFAISSSGNAGLAAGLYIKETNKDREEKIKLEILVGNKVNKIKLKKINDLLDENIRLSQVEKPLQSLFERTKDESIKGLRQSTDDNALLGYESLAQEIINIPNVKRVYIGSSSGTTAQALLEYFIKNKKNIEVNIVQTSSCHYMVDGISEDIPKDEISIADAIVDKTAFRKDKISKLIKDTDSKCFVATNEEITNALDIVKNNTGIDISPNGVLSIVGLMKDSYTRKLSSTNVCIVCGI